MTEFLEKEENSLPARKEWRALAGRTGREPQLVSCYCRKEKRAFAVYNFERPLQKLPGLRVGCFFRTDSRRRSFVSASMRSPITPSPSYVPFETVRIFIELLELPRGWNSYNAKQIRKENVGAALDLLNRVMRPGTPAPIVVPTVRGGVQLEWHTKGINLEIAIDSADDISFFAEDIRNTEEPEQEIDESTLPQWIERISAR